MADHVDDAHGSGPSAGAATATPEPAHSDAAAQAIGAPRPAALPDTLQAKVELFRAGGHIVRERDELFTEAGWLQVLAGQGIEPEGHHPLADQIAPADLAEFTETIELLYRREASRMPAHAELIARQCAMRVAA